MDISTAIGLILGIGLVSQGIIFGHGQLQWFLNPPAIGIVLGGTLAATLVNYPIQNFMQLFKVTKVIFGAQKSGYIEMINLLVDKAEKARKTGIMSLEADLASINDKFLRNGIELAINEQDANRLRNFLSLELSNIRHRHAIAQEIFFYMGAYAPAFGMLGTVMGLIVMMNNFSGGGGDGAIGKVNFDVAAKFAELLAGMGLALITTFYGVLLSNLVFLPIGGKLKRKSEEEIMVKNIMAEGIIGIHAKDHPILLREKLMTFVPQSKRTKKE
ncbi:MAG: MotA/TolQ/ExbB proton channel family protein [Candidatus Neomarinimicrobiota bacterium]